MKVSFDGGGKNTIYNDEKLTQMLTIFHNTIDMTCDALQTTGSLSRIWGTVQAMITSDDNLVPNFWGLGHDPEVFEKLATICFQSVLPRKVWLSNFDKNSLSDFVTVADETLAYLILENNFSDWMSIVKKDVVESKKRKRNTKYTMVGGQGTSRGSRKGWSTKGKEQYNKYFDLITNARKRIRVKKMEKIWCFNGKWRRKV